MAWRYLQGAQGRAEGRSFIRFITYVAIGGVALGVAALLLALSIVRGFSREIENKIVGFGSHVQVSSYLQEGTIGGADEMAADLSERQGVERVMPVVERFVLLRRSSESIDGVVLYGVDEPPPYLEGQIVAGSFALAPDTTSRPGLVIGRQLAERLGVEVGEKVTVFALRDGGNGASLGLSQPRVKQFYVTGVYETALANIDDLYVFAGIETARQLAHVPDDEVSRFDLTLRDVSKADSIAQAIEEDYGFPVAARTIYQQYRGLFAWVNLQESIIPIVIGVIVIVAAFNIVGILLMMILEKTREIGVLQSLGASKSDLRRLFLALGILIGAVGTIIGESLALTLGLLQQRYDIIPLPAEAYYMNSAPVELSLFDFVLVGGIALVLCALAAYIPARVAARIEPVRAIRFQ